MRVKGEMCEQKGISRLKSGDSGDTKNKGAESFELTHKFVQRFHLLDEGSLKGVSSIYTGRTFSFLADKSVTLKAKTNLSERN